MSTGRARGGKPYRPAAARPGRQLGLDDVWRIAFDQEGAAPPGLPPDEVLMPGTSVACTRKEAARHLLILALVCRTFVRAVPEDARKALMDGVAGVAVDLHFENMVERLEREI